MEKELLKEKLEILKEKLKTLKDLKFKNTAKITVGITLVLFWSMLMYSYGMNNETNNCVNYDNGYEDGYNVAYEKVNKDLTLLANRTNKYTSLTPEQTTVINKQIDELKQKEKDELEAAKKAEEEKKKQEEIAKKEEEERKKISKEFLDKNEELSKKISEVQSNNAKLGINLIFKLVEAIPKAEKEVYKVLSDIYYKDISEIEGQSLEETIEQIKGILQCDSFKYFFSLATH